MKPESETTKKAAESPVDALVSGTVNFMEFEPIKEDVEFYRDLRNNEDERVQNTGKLLMPKKGTKYWLQIECEDPEILQAVLISMYRNEGGSNSFVPGAKMESIYFEHPGKEAIKEFLTEKLNEMEDKEYH